MKRLSTLFISALLSVQAVGAASPEPAPDAYTPSEEVMASRREFQADRFGIFIHWGIYSMFGQGEWYLNSGIRADEYAKAAGGFYPAAFNAGEWAEAIKNSGAKYVCFTTRHHDGFSMWHTAQSPFNIADATPFRRDILKELSEACREKGLKLHLYYSHLDWSRDDYPRGSTGKENGRPGTGENRESYFKFMEAQLRELLTGYGPVRAIWFDGWWDHQDDPEPFDWRLDEQYALVHSLQPGCLVGNNHHRNTFPGEDIQIFERDVPGENSAGYSGQDISRLPLETCQTMNDMWGYKVADTDYKDSPTLIRYLVKTAGLGANLLLNIGPQPDGNLPAEALVRLKDIGEWLAVYGETIYGTSGSPFGNKDWGTATVKGNSMFIHITNPPADGKITVPTDADVAEAFHFASRTPMKFSRTRDGITFHADANPDEPDYVVQLNLKKKRGAKR